MEYTHLGRSGLSVSRLCLGTMNFGWKTEEADSHAIMDRAHAEGDQLLRHRQRLRLRRRQGPHRGGARHLVRPGRRAPREDRAGHQGLRRHVRLAERHVPVRPQHRAGLRRVAAPDADRLDRPLPVPPRRPERRRGRRSGRPARRSSPRARCSTSARPTTPPGRSPRPTRRPPAGTSRAWSASSRTTTCSPGTSSSRCCRPPSTTASASSRGARWPAACSPGCWRRRRADAGATEHTQKRVEKHRAALEEYEAFCRELGSAPADVGLAWLLHQPAVTAPIIGPRTMEQFEGALAALGAVARRGRAGPAGHDLPRLQGGPHGVRLVADPPSHHHVTRGQAATVSYGDADPRWLSISRTSVTGHAGPR